MNIRDFKYIIAIDKFKSFVKAAEECFISQPALSMQIKKIEDVLGIKIFERDKKTVITTWKGEEVVKYAKDTLEIYNSLRAIKNFKEQIRIGIIYTVSNYLLLKIMPLLGEQDNVKFTFFEDKTVNLVKDLEKGNLDAIILASNTSCKPEIEKYKSFYEHSLFKETLVLTLPKEHNFNSAKTKLSNQDIKSLITSNELILLEDGHCLNESIDEIVKHYKVVNKLKSNLFTSNVTTIIKMISSNNGISILPKSSVVDIPEIKYFEMPNNETRLISLYYRKNTAQFNYINNLIEATKQINTYV